MMTEDVHPMELLNSFSISATSTLPYGISNYDRKVQFEEKEENVDSANSSSSRRGLQTFSTPDAPLVLCSSSPPVFPNSRPASQWSTGSSVTVWDDNAKSDNYRIRASYYQGCLQYSKTFPGSFNANYDFNNVSIEY